MICRQKNSTGGVPAYDQSHAHNFSWGTVNYVHGTAETIWDVDPLKGKSVDMVFMGQAIEHFYPEKLEQILQYVHTKLVKGGHFCFDTPNRLLTSIQSPDAFIDLDHKIEYEPKRLAEIVEKCGFRILGISGICLLPHSRKSRVFDPIESYATPKFSDDFDDGYCFGIVAQSI